VPILIAHARRASTSQCKTDAAAGRADIRKLLRDCGLGDSGWRSPLTVLLSKSMGSFNEKVALVTGGGLGLGEAMAKSLATKGAMVVLTDIKPEDATRVAKEIADAGGVASAIAQDVSKPELSENVVRYAVSTYGALHYAINNAGIGGA